MTKPLVFKIVTPGFSLRRATCELGDFRIWYEDECWFWSLDEDSEDGLFSYGSEETLSEAMTACQNYYEAFQP